MNSMILLDYQSRTPIYLQIVYEIEKYVALGIMKPNDQIPSIRELASTLGINPNTVKKAYDELENKKVINTISTKGTFISNKIDSVLENKRKEKLNDLNKCINELNRLGMSKEQIIKYIK